MTAHLILGGAGFIGRHVARDLLAEGHDVILAGRRDQPPRELLESLSTDRTPSYVRIDLAEQDWRGVADRCEVVHHYAWGSVPHTANDAPLHDFERHVASTMRLLEALKQAGGKRIVFLSSGGTVYGDIGRRAAREDDAQRPVSAYGAGKLAVETYLRAYHLSGWVDARIARLSNPYGAGQDLTRNQGAVGVFLHRAVRGEPLHIWGDGEVVRDYVHVSDVGAALAGLSRERFDAGEGLPVFNVGSGEGASLNDVIATLETALGETINVRREPGRPFDVPFSVLDVTHARDRLGWRPAVTLAEGVRMMLDDVRDGALLSTRPAGVAKSDGVEGRAAFV